jgi:GTP-binding protein LepA
MKVRLMASGGAHEVEQLGVFTPKPVPVDSLSAGEVGFVIAGIKKVSDVAIGDTLTDDRKPALEPLPGFKEIKPMVFAGLYPVDADQYAELRDALEKLRLNDSSFFYEPETSTALGFGFRCGFLGLLHMEIVQERLEREFNLELLVTAPSVRYRVLKRTARWSKWTRRHGCPIPAGSTRSRSRSSRPRSSPGTSSWAES